MNFQESSKTVVDRQRSKVYTWENKEISPKDNSIVWFDGIQAIVDYVWKEERLLNPPKVIPIAKQGRRADATRLELRFPTFTKTWIIIHEISHAMTAFSDGQSNHHGALFVGIYCQLLSRYLKFDFEKLIKSAKEAGIKVKADAIPVFV